MVRDIELYFFWFILNKKLKIGLGMEENETKNRLFSRSAELKK